MMNPDRCVSSAPLRACVSVCECVCVCVYVCVCVSTSPSWLPHLINVRPCYDELFRRAPLRRAPPPHPSGAPLRRQQLPRGITMAST